MRILVFNIETVPDSNIPATLIPQPNDFDAPANWKDPVKIEEFKREKVKEEMAKMSLSPLTGYIVCYSEIFIDTEVPDSMTQTTLSLPTNTEADIVKHFFDRLKVIGERDWKIIGYNSKAFDYPYLVMKGLQYGLISEQDAWLGSMVSKYHSELHLDIYLYLSGFESRKKGKLAQWGERMGCKEKVFGSGDMVGGWFENSDMASIIAHCESNVKVTYELARRIFLDRQIEMNNRSNSDGPSVGGARIDNGF